MIVAVTGIRDLAQISEETVTLAIREFQGATEWRFGGARGVDTVALKAAHQWYPDVPRRVYVPCTLADQPAQVRGITRRLATAIIELNLPQMPASYLKRNDALLADAHCCLGFTDGRSKGGTFYTIGKARRSRLQVTVVQVEASKA